MILQGNSYSIAQKIGKTWSVQTELQQIYPKTDRLLGPDNRLPVHAAQMGLYMASTLRRQTPEFFSTSPPITLKFS